MWAAKPPSSPIPASASGFDFFLVSPAIDVMGWEEGVVLYTGYECTLTSNRDYPWVVATGTPAGHEYR
jgi:hypothetical protein